MTCNRSAILGWERFEVVDAGSGRVALRGNNGQYVSSENGTGPMFCNRTEIGAWERFQVVNIGGGRIALRANHGEFVSSENGSAPMRANRGRAGGWELFNVDIVSTGRTINGNTEIAAAGGNALVGIRNAIRKAGPGGTVNLRGTHRINGSISVEQPGLTIDGGFNCVLQERTDVSPAATFSIRASDVTFKNFSIHGNPANQTFHALVELNGSEDFTATGMTFRDGQNSISSFFKPANGLKVLGCTFIGGNNGVLFLRDVVRAEAVDKLRAALNGADLTITGCTFGGVIRNPINFDAGNDGSDGTDTFPDRTNPLRTQIRNRPTRFFKQRGGRSQISNNTFTGITKFGVAIATCQGISVRDNVFTMSENAFGFSHCVHFEHSSTDCDATGNTFNIGNANRDVAGIVTGTFTDFGNISSSLNGGRRLQIDNNTFFTNVGAGIVGNGFRDLTIRNNDLRGVTNNREYVFFETPTPNDPVNSFGTVTGNLPRNP